MKPNAGFLFYLAEVFLLSYIFWFQLLFHELMNRYQECFYLFKGISHGDSKYRNDI